MRRMTARRDRAMILFLLDTGLRASEFCSLTIGDVDQKTGRVVVKHGTLGGAKGGKGRIVFFGKATRNPLWRYLAKLGKQAEIASVIPVDFATRLLPKTLGTNQCQS